MERMRWERIKCRIWKGRRYDLAWVQHQASCLKVAATYKPVLKAMSSEPVNLLPNLIRRDGLVTAKGNEGPEHWWSPGMVCVPEDLNARQDPVGWHVAVDVLTHAGSFAPGTAPGIREALRKISILEVLLPSHWGSWYFWGRIGWAGHSAVRRNWGAFPI